jgi:CRISPR system Cascade subunit CasE
LKLSIVELSPADCARLKFKDLYSIHRIVYEMFPGSVRDFLYLDLGHVDGKRKIFILSEREPFVKFGAVQTKNIPESFLCHNKYSFKIKMNSVIEVAGKRIPPSDDFQWFLRNSNKWGFSTKKLIIENKEAVFIYKGKEKRTYNIVTFSGILEVINPDVFKNSFKKGISKAKAYGFGLLQIIPIIERG